MNVENLVNNLHAIINEHKVTDITSLSSSQFEIEKEGEVIFCIEKLSFHPMKLSLRNVVEYSLEPTDPINHSTRNAIIRSLKNKLDSDFITYQEQNLRSPIPSGLLNSEFDQLVSLYFRKIENFPSLLSNIYSVKNINELNVHLSQESLSKNDLNFMNDFFSFLGLSFNKINFIKDIEDTNCIHINNVKNQVAAMNRIMKRKSL
ncbi:hypothetical protein [Photobacterium leiognathi]|uniref:hypothetical protein n=1 Tax=Photobacterium leiognathi TaxID=553611 RepID=UPI002981445E|nr:hypothetical protein [Photobacterium leiognathi]